MRLCLTLLILNLSTVAISQIPGELITRAERSNYTETSTHQDVLDFVRYVTANSSLAHSEIMLTSIEGREVPLVVLADPPVTSPVQAENSGKVIVYIQGNIHGGEVEGKEATMIMMREILFGEKQHLLDNQIVLFCPNYNADGNDKMSEDNRRSQEGSPRMTGERRSGQDFDLNRDGMKMEAVETQGLIQNIILKWDPDLFVDLHTTNGSWHGNSLTYAPSYHTAGHPATSDYTMEVMLPALKRAVLDKHDLHFDIYGGFSLREGWPPKSLYTYNHHPRYLVNQFGLRNRMAILSETFAHDPFYRRIQAAHAFVNEILEYTNRHGHDIMAINKKAESETIDLVRELAGTLKKGVQFEMVPTEEPLRLRAYQYVPYSDDEGRTRYARQGNIVYIDGVANYNAFEATIKSTVPAGYVLPAELTNVVDKLRAHGATVSELQGEQEFSGEEFTVESLERAGRQFEGHYMASLTGSFSPTTKTFPGGSYVVSMEQPLASLIFYLLEPQSDDGLVAWNFFDTYLEDNGIQNGPVPFPVFKFWE